MEFLGDWVLDFDRSLDLLIKCWESVPPESHISATTMKSFEGWKRLPFLWGYNFDDAGLHAIFVDSLDEGLEASELIHSLRKHH